MKAIQILFCATMVLAAPLPQADGNGKEEVQMSGTTVEADKVVRTDAGADKEDGPETESKVEAESEGEGDAKAEGEGEAEGEVEPNSEVDGIYANDSSLQPDEIVSGPEGNGHDNDYKHDPEAKRVKEEIERAKRASGEGTPLSQIHRKPLFDHVPFLNHIVFRRSLNGTTYRIDNRKPETKIYRLPELHQNSSSSSDDDTKGDENDKEEKRTVHSFLFTDEGNATYVPGRDLLIGYGVTSRDKVLELFDSFQGGNSTSKQDDEAIMAFNKFNVATQYGQAVLGIERPDLVLYEVIVNLDKVPEARGVQLRPDFEVDQEVFRKHPELFGDFVTFRHKSEEIDGMMALLSPKLAPAVTVRPAPGFRLVARTKKNMEEGDEDN